MKKLLPLLVVCLIPTFAFAADITVQDTTGQVRFVSDVDKGNSLEFTVEKKGGADAAGSAVKLTNTATGEVLDGTVTDGKVVFTGLSEGTYTISSDETGIVFVNVGVASATTVAAVGGTSLILPIVGGVAAVGGVTAISIAATDGNGNNDDTPLSPNT